MKIFFFLIIIESYLCVPQVGYVYSSCAGNNNLVFSQSNGGTIYMSTNDQNSTLSGYGLMNNSHIINCSVVLQGQPQGSLTYQRFFGFHFRLWNYDTNSAARYDPLLTNFYFLNEYATIKKACGDTCATGCMQVMNSKSGTIDTLCGANQLTGLNYPDYFIQNYVNLRFYLLGGFYNTTGNVTSTILAASKTSFIIDFYSFYFGACTDSTTQFQCINTDRCIGLDLKCDVYGGMDCGVPPSGGNTTYDQQNCTSPSLLPLLALLAIIGVPLLIFALIWLFYRPGICCWRCARLRNCPGCDRTNYRKCCIHPAVLGSSLTACTCCALSLIPKSPNTCICCTGTKQNGLDSEGNEDDSDLKDAEKNSSFGWNEYASGDGYHLRECR